MRAIPAALIAAQRQAPLATPRVRVRIKNSHATAQLYEWTRWYTGTETPNWHAACGAGNDAIARFWVNPADQKLYRQYVAAPTADSFRGLHLDGDGDYILETQDIDLTATDFTWECGFTTEWTPTGDGQMRYLKCHWQGVFWLVYEQTGGVKRLRLTSYDGAALRHCIYNITLIEGQRYHAAAVYDNGGVGMRLYLDGVQVASNANNANLLGAAGNEVVGAQGDGLLSWLGNLDEIRLSNIRRYTAAFTPAATFTDDANTLYLWHLEDGTGTTATDDNSVRGAPQRNGTLQGNPTWRPGWTELASNVDDVAVCAQGIYVELFYVDHSIPYHIFYMLSDDYGANFGAAIDTGIVGNQYTRVAAAHRANGDLALFYSVSNVVYGRIWDHVSWDAAVALTKTFTSQPDLAVVWWYDWHVLITGQDSANRWGVWAAAFGDGFEEPIGVWSETADIMLRKTTETYSYRAPSICSTDLARFAFIERFTGSPELNRLYWSHCVPNASPFYGFCLEPQPFNYESYWGADYATTTGHIYLVAPDGIWHATRGVTTTDITNDVVEADYKINAKAFTSKLTVVLDNTSGKYNDFDKLGHQITIEWGYQTTSGPLYQAGPAAWITGWRFVSPPWFPLRALWPQGVIGTLKIEAETTFDLLKRWQTRRDIEWAASTKNLFQILSYIFGRIGFDYSTFSGSTPLGDYYPEFTMKTGRNGQWAVKKLLSWLEDVMRQYSGTVSDRIFTSWPQASDAAVETYNTTYQVAHLLYRGDYGRLSWDPNRAQVVSTTLQVEDQNWAEIAAVYDRLKRITEPDYTSQTFAEDRAAAELRKGQMWNEGKGTLSATMNCRIELWDVINITDTAGGVVAINRRITGIHSYYNKRSGAYIQTLTLGAV